jgi:hypothetical protein
MDKSTAVRSMVFGGIMFMVGLLITVGSYTAAEGGNGGGRYVVAWGAMIFGAIRFGYGVVKLNQANRNS